MYKRTEPYIYDIPLGRTSPDVQPYNRKMVETYGLNPTIEVTDAITGQSANDISYKFGLDTDGYINQIIVSNQPESGYKVKIKCG